MKASQIKEWARGNGIPCHGDLIETIVDGTKYRAEFYASSEYGSKPQLCLAADSKIEELKNGEWIEVSFPETESGDDAFNNLLSKITPTLEDDC